MRWKGVMPPIDNAWRCAVCELQFCLADLTKTVDLPKCEMKDKQVVLVRMTWTACEECLDCAVADRQTTRAQRTRSLTLANMSSDADANDKASNVLALLITAATTTLEVILCVRTTERSERATGEPKQ